MTMLNHRVQGPRTKEEFEREARLMSRGRRIPGDDIDDMLRVIQDGDHINEDDGLTETPDYEEPGPSAAAFEAVVRIPQVATPEIPIEILDVLKSPERHELLEVARHLRRSQEHARTLIFITPIGDIKCTVNWMSCNPGEISSASMFFVKTRANSLAFVPKPGAVFDISFEGYPGQTRVMCLAEPQRLYPGVDLLCFMLHNPGMEKNGQLKEGAPSVVSGSPSTEIIDDEPVADGEKPMSKAAFTIGNPHTGFDNPRPL